MAYGRGSQTSRRGRSRSKTTRVWSRRPQSGDEEGGLKRAVGALDLTALGIGAVIGTGIFVVIGEGIGERGAGRDPLVRARRARPACSRRCRYAELASSIPVSGSAYTYAYATLGELVAWIIGWDLILEYGVSVAAVAVGWGGNLNEFLENAFGYDAAGVDLDRPRGRRHPQPARGGRSCIAVMFLLSRGVRETARANLIMVGVKLADPRLLHRRGLRRGVQRRQPEAVRARGRRRRRERRRGDLLRLHRLRRGLDRRRGGARTQAATCRSRSSARS